MKYTGASVSGVVAAPIEAVWELVSDVTRHPQIAGSREVQVVTIAGGGSLAQGKVFQSRQKMRGLAYMTASKVWIWEPPYRFAWRVGVPGAPGLAQTWLFELAPVAGGTQVTNGVALIYAFPTFPPFTTIAQKIAAGYAGSIHPTLHNIAAALGAPPPSEIIERLEPPPAALAQMPPPAVPVLALGLGALVMAVAARRLVSRGS